MKTGFGYAVFLVIAALIFIILMQHRQASALRNELNRMGGDSRALQSVMRNDETNAFAVQKELRRMQRENDELRDETNRLQKELRKQNRAPGSSDGISSQPF